jgi:hypothetical protein
VESVIAGTQDVEMTIAVAKGDHQIIGRYDLTYTYGEASYYTYQSDALPGNVIA